jgi:hypothetical protein
MASASRVTSLVALLICPFAMLPPPPANARAKAESYRPDQGEAIDDGRRVSTPRRPLQKVERADFNAWTLKACQAS